MDYLKIAELLFTEAQKLNLQPKWLTDYGLFSITSNQKRYFVYYSYTMLNSHISSRLSWDKHITRVILEESHLPNIPYIRPKTEKELAGFIIEHKVIIGKPTQSSHSQGVRMIRTIKDVKDLDFSEYIFEKYIPGEEYRYLVLEEKVIAVHRKQYEPPIKDPNGVKSISLDIKEWNMKLIALAIRTADVLHLFYAAVDFMIDTQGKAYILEVNSASGPFSIQQKDQ